jgi:hypothetical protein
MDEGLHYYKPQAQKIEYTSQTKLFCYDFCFPSIILNLCTPKCCLLIGNVNCASLQAK